MIPKALERKAVIAALKARQEAGIADDVPICPYDFALSRGARVRFMAVPSMEGIYDRQAKTIVVSSLRWRGRRAFTCAHEYAHHVFDDGSHVDELPEDRKGPRPIQELLADRFAGLLLMPRLAVLNGFKQRRIQPSICTPTQAYAISCWLGVSYEAFLTHASLAVGVMPVQVANALQRFSPKEVKAQIAPPYSDGDLMVVDEHWTHAIDLVVGDVVKLPAGTSIDGSIAVKIEDTAEATYVRAVSRGIGRAVRGEWTASIRVMPAKYIGLARCRHLPEEDYE